MTKSGTISLCNNVQIVQRKDYNCAQTRENIVKAWKRIYGDQFYYCWIQISPHTIDDEISKDGTNLKRIGVAVEPM